MGPFSAAPRLLPLLALALLFGACGSDKPEATTVDRLAVEGYAPTFPPPIEFKAEEWEDGGKYPQIGSPNAKRDMQDRPLTIVWDSYPPTLRTDGPNSNLITLSQLHGLIYEPMLSIHPDTTQFFPMLASHWQREVDEEAGRQTFRFRLNPRARWSDGSEVTADDVYWSWWHRVQEDRKDPSNVLTFSDYQEPKILDKYTIQVTTSELNWRLFLYFGGMAIYPARYIKIDGDTYLNEYNWRLMPGTGPYLVAEIRKGESLTMKRRDDWWAENERWARGTYNFGRIKYTVIRDREIEYERFKNDELDFFVVSRAQRWVEDIPKEEIINKGWVQKRKIYNESPEGFSGFAFNMRKWPFDDKRVRLAFAHLFNREQLFEKLFFNEYDYIDSYFPGRDWGNADKNAKIRFDPQRAEQLLAEAGYKTRNDEGYLVGPDGKMLEVTLRYGAQAWERIWLPVKQDYEDAGIKFNLELMDPSTLLKKISDRQFTIHFQSWGALLFPNPETSWHSKLADQPANNNITGFQNARVDALCEEYNRVFDRERQKEIVREIDRLVFEEHPYALAWYSQFDRILWWDRFGYPETYESRIGQTPSSEILSLWWFDQEKNDRLAKSRAEDRELGQHDDIVVRPWAKR